MGGWGNQKVMGSIPVSDSEVFSSEKNKLVSTRTFLLWVGGVVVGIFFFFMRKELPKVFTTPQ